MPLPTITVPPFPNVPNVPGVPPILRQAGGALDSLTGSLTGVLAPSGQFTAQINGLLLQVSGQVTPIIGTLNGVLDVANNFNAALSAGSVLGGLNVLTGGLSGQVIGTVTGLVDRVSGVLRGAFSGTSAGITGKSGTALADAQNGALDTAVWGIFDSGGVAVIVGDNVAAVDHVSDYRVSTYPVEKGGFQSYNKVETPFAVRVTFTKGGTIAERTAFLASIETAKASLDLYDVVTPEKTYRGVNVIHSDIRRTASNGAGLLTVDVGCEQVRTTATAAFTNTKAPSGAGDINAGPVQPVPPTAGQAAATGKTPAAVPPSDPIGGGILV